MEPNIELHLLNYRLRILTIKKNSIHKLMHPLVKIAFTNKTKCTFFSFNETNDDYSIVVDEFGFKELIPFINENDLTLSQSNWIPMYLCGEDLPGSMSLSKIAKYLILPLADHKISIMAISMYQCDYILIKEEDYERAIDCLSVHIPKIYDESLPPENEIIFMKTKHSTSFSKKQEIKEQTIESNLEIKRQSSINVKQNRQITLPLLIPDNIEYCITGLYNLDNFFLIIPTLIDIMFFETENYKDEIFFNFTKKETDISLVMETKLLKEFPIGTLLNIENDYWKLVRIGQLPVGLEVFGVVASISQPLELANIDEYYISSYHTGYCFIPCDKLDTAKELFAKRKASFVETSKTLNESMLDTDDGVVDENSCENDKPNNYCQDHYPTQADKQANGLIMNENENFDTKSTISLTELVKD